tara:strand:- start:2507 stop:3076 length:570 start_codon:yes stop_codon:yes gene_type:complete
MGLIYKFVIGEECYVGSTKNLIERQKKHNRNLRNENYNYLLYKKCREYKIEKIILELIEDEVEEEDLKIREQFYIDKLKPTLNSLRAFTTEEDTKLMDKEWHKKNYENNKEKVLEKVKEYQQNNKEKVKIQKKEWYENNKEKINEKLKEKVKCDLCNIEIRKTNLKRHKLSATCKKMWDYMLDTDTDTN